MCGSGRTEQSGSRSHAVHVGGRHAGGVSGRPLHELDPVAVRVGRPGRPETWSRLGGRFGRYTPAREIGDRRVEVVGLADEVVDGTGVGHRSRRVSARVRGAPGGH